MDQYLSPFFRNIALKIYIYMYIIKQFRLTINKLDVGYSKIVTKMLWFTYLILLLAK